MSTAVNDFVDLSFRADLNLLFGRWLRHVDDLEVRQGYEAALSVAAPRRARYWLLDLRRRGPASPHAARWVAETFLPQAANCLSTHVYLAYLLSPHHLADVPHQEAVTCPPPERCTVGLFADEGSALQWLQACRGTGAEPSDIPATPLSTAR